MAKWGNFLLRNVLRHTDAHNKIQEEKEMWKMRGSQMQPDVSTRGSTRGNMHCDRVSDGSKTCPPKHDDREARYWSRKLYEFEANDPDRWGHSGFKELYPEEFSSDSEGGGGEHRRRKKTEGELSVSKRAKKSKDKKKKKKKKKKKEEEEGKRKKADVSSSSEAQSTRSKERRKSSKSKQDKGKRRSRRRDTGESSSQDMGDGLERQRGARCGKKRKQDSHRDTDSGPDGPRSKRAGRREDWKEPAEENSDDSSGD